MKRSLFKTMMLLGVAAFVLWWDVSDALGQPVPNGNGQPPSSWNGQGQAPAGFVSAHTFYWMLGVGGTIVASLTTVIGILWKKLGEKSKDADSDVLAQVVLIKTDLGDLHTLAKNRIKSLEEEIARKDRLLDQKDERLEKQHEKTLKIAVRAQQAVEAMANLPIGDNVLDGDQED